MATTDPLADAIAAVRKVMADAGTIDFVDWMEYGELADGHRWEVRGPDGDGSGITVTVFAPDGEEIDSDTIGEPMADVDEANFDLFTGGDWDQMLSEWATARVREILGDAFDAYIDRQAFHNGVVVATGKVTHNGRPIYTAADVASCEVSRTGVANAAEWRAAGIEAGENLVEGLRRWARLMAGDAKALLELMTRRSR